MKTNTPSSAQVGDVLYMPRGTIHCATAQQGGPSGHLTISTYQRWSAADLLQYGVSVALANPSLQPLLPAPLKAGLPPGFLAAATLGPAAAAELAAGAGGFGEDGTAAIVAAAAAPAGGGGADGKAVSGSGDVQPLAAQLAAACRALADCLEGRKGGSGLGPRLLTTAADAMAEDFLRHRRGRPPPGRARAGGCGSPPHPGQLAALAALKPLPSQPLCLLALLPRLRLLPACGPARACTCPTRAAALAARRRSLTTVPLPSMPVQAAAPPRAAANARAAAHPGRRCAVRERLLLPASADEHQ